VRAKEEIDLPELSAFPCNMAWAAAGHPFGSAGWLIPYSENYDRFTRVFHSRTGGGTGISWQGLARERGVPWHPEIQFSDLAGAGENAWLGDARSAGS
jgi:hypothetical protein